MASACGTARIKLSGADQWHDEIGQALDRCDWFLVIVSPNALKSMWVKRELTYALSLQRYRRRIIPVIFKNCRWRSLSWTLGSSQLVNFQTSFSKGRKQLLKIWGIRA